MCSARIELTSPTEVGKKQSLVKGIRGKGSQIGKRSQSDKGGAARPVGRVALPEPGLTLPALVQSQTGGCNPHPTCSTSGAIEAGVTHARGGLANEDTSSNKFS